jgi:hypothetical protein
MVRCASLGARWASEAALATPVQRVRLRGLGYGPREVAEGERRRGTSPGAGKVALYLLRGLGEAIRPVKGLNWRKLAPGARETGTAGGRCARERGRRRTAEGGGAERARWPEDRWGRRRGGS